MENKGFQESLAATKEQYFEAAGKVLTQYNLAELSMDSFRKLVAAGKKVKRSIIRKSAS